MPAISGKNRFLHVLALGALALSAPLFGVLASEPQFWVARRSTYLDIIFVAALVTAVSVCLGVASLAVNKADRNLGDLLHISLVVVLSSLALLPLVDRIPFALDGAWVDLAAAALLGLVSAFIYVRSSGLRSVLVYVSAGHAVLIAWLFLSAPGLGEGDPSEIDWTAVNDAPVVFVVFDELPTATLLGLDGDINTDRFPNFARLASESVWYSNAYTVSDSSVSALPALLTGMFPESGRFGLVGDYPFNLFTVLNQTHSMNLQEGLTRLCPRDMCPESVRAGDRMSTLTKDLAVIFLHVVLPDELAGDLPSIGVAWEGFVTEDQTSEDAGQLGPLAGELSERTSSETRAIEFGQFLDAIADSSGPHVHYAHVELPHPPWEYFPNGERYAFADWIGGLSAAGVWVEDRLQTLQALQRYDLQLQFTDQLLGMLLDTMEQSGIRDEALLVVTSDHGLNFQPGEPRREATAETVGSLAPVPLFIKLPGQESGSIDERRTLHVDVLPTILDALGGKGVADIDGQSLLTGRGWPGDLELVIGNSTETLDGIAYKAREDARWLLSERRRLERSDWLYAGPDGFFGADVSDFRVVSAAGTISLAWPDLYTSLKPGTYLATNVRAQIGSTVTNSPRLFAISINGTIWDVTSRVGDILNFVVPRESYVDGPNTVEIYGLDLSRRDPELIEYVGQQR